MKQAMVFAAGLGTRLKPLTDTMPKALVRVGGQPLLWHVIMKLKAAGYERIVVNVHHFAQQIVDYLSANDNFGLDIRISDETSGLLETGGGIRKALPLFDPSSPVLIHNVDILTGELSLLCEVHEAQRDCPLCEGIPHPDALLRARPSVICSSTTTCAFKVGPISKLVSSEVVSVTDALPSLAFTSSGQPSSLCWNRCPSVSLLWTSI